MKIIAVNINKALDSGANVKDATERAWKLNKENCSGYKYVIGVSKGVIRGYFKLNGVTTDLSEPPRVKFDLVPCSPSEKDLIDRFIDDEGINLNGITTKYI